MEDVALDGRSGWTDWRFDGALGLACSFAQQGALGAFIPDGNRTISLSAPGIHGTRTHSAVRPHCYSYSVQMRHRLAINLRRRVRAQPHGPAASIQGGGTQAVVPMRHTHRHDGMGERVSQERCCTANQSRRPVALLSIGLACCTLWLWGNDMRQDRGRSTYRVQLSHVSSCNVVIANR